MAPRGCLLICVIVSLQVLWNVQAEICPLNEVFASCGTPCEPTCDDPETDRHCKASCAPPGCYCAPGTARNAQGDCVILAHCHSETCPSNEVFASCGTPCEPTCDDPETDRHCKAMCAPPGCYCAPGTARNAQGHCVILDHCYCKFAVQCKPPCCECARNFVRNDEAESCPQNQEFAHCGTYCEPTCDEPEILRPCSAACALPGCYCSAGTVKNDHGDCVIVGDCPSKSCPLNQEFTTCGTYCEPTCDEPEILRPCSAACALPGCYCSAGTVKNDQGDCVKVEDCP